MIQGRWKIFRTKQYMSELGKKSNHRIRMSLQAHSIEASTFFIFSDSVNGSRRDVVLQEIASASTRLQKVLSRTWEQVEETLWLEVLSNLAAAASSCENPSAGVNLQAMSSIWDSIHYRHHTSLCQVNQLSGVTRILYYFTYYLYSIGSLCVLCVKKTG